MHKGLYRAHRCFAEITTLNLISNGNTAYIHRYSGQIMIIILFYRGEQVLVEKLSGQKQRRKVLGGLQQEFNGLYFHADVKSRDARVDLNVRIRVFVVPHVIFPQPQRAHEYIDNFRFATQWLSHNGYGDKAPCWQLSKPEIFFLEFRAQR
jgi:hypothetical protein